MDLRLCLCCALLVLAVARHHTPSVTTAGARAEEHTAKPQSVSFPRGSAQAPSSVVRSKFSDSQHGVEPDHKPASSLTLSGEDGSAETTTAVTSPTSTLDTLLPQLLPRLQSQPLPRPSNQVLPVPPSPSSPPPRPPPPPPPPTLRAPLDPATLIQLPPIPPRGKSGDLPPHTPLVSGERQPKGRAESEQISPFTNKSGTEEMFWKEVAAAYNRFCNRPCQGNGHTGCSSCFHDKVCLVYGDCCPDIYASFGQMYRPAMHTYVSCSRTSFGGAWSTSKGHLMVTRCPPGENKSVNLKCDSEDWTQPVTDIETHITFKNPDCARCHGSSSLLPWKATAFIYDSPTALDLVDSGVVDGETLDAKSSREIYHRILQDNANEIMYEPPYQTAKYARPCAPGQVSKCNFDRVGKDFDVYVNRACTLLNLPVDLYRTPYKNPFCFFCNSPLNWTDVSST